MRQLVRPRQCVVPRKVEEEAAVIVGDAGEDEEEDVFFGDHMRVEEEAAVVGDLLLYGLVGNRQGPICHTPRPATPHP